MKVLDNLDLNLNQLLNAVVQQLGTDVTPAAGNKGQVFYHTGSDEVRYSTGAAVAKLTNVIEALSIGTANGLSLGALTGKNQPLSLALASGGSAGAMSTAHYTLVNGATNLNTASTLVLRDASGNFSAGTITAALTGTASNATQLNNQAASYYLSRTNHTGTQLASTVSDFDTQVRTSSLNQMTAPTADLSINTHKLTNLVDPTNPQDAATKGYVDGVASGLDVKASVRAASTANVAGITYNATGGTSGRGQITVAPNTLDGVTLAVGNRILLKNQTTAAQNGIWTVTTVGTGANGVWDRASDFDQDAEVTAGAFTFIEEGTALGDTGWVLTTNNPITIGGASGTALAFAQFNGAGSYTASNGVSLTGSNFAAVVDTTAVNANSLSVSATGITIATTYVGQTSITTLGTVTTGVWSGTAIAVAKGGTGGTDAATARTNLGAAGKYAQTLATSATSYAVTHSLNSVNVVAECFDASTGAKVLVDYTITDANTVTFTFATAPTSNAYRVVVVG